MRWIMTPHCFKKPLHSGCGYSLKPEVVREVEEILSRFEGDGATSALQVSQEALLLLKEGVVSKLGFGSLVQYLVRLPRFERAKKHQVVALKIMKCAEALKEVLAGMKRSPTALWNDVQILTGHFVIIRRCACIGINHNEQAEDYLLRKNRPDF